LVPPEVSDPGSSARPAIPEVRDPLTPSCLRGLSFSRREITSFAWADGSSEDSLATVSVSVETVLRSAKVAVARLAKDSDSSEWAADLGEASSAAKLVRGKCPPAVTWRSFLQERCGFKKTFQSLSRFSHKGVENLSGAEIRLSCFSKRHGL